MEALSDLIPRIYDAGCAETPWNEVMGAISRRLGATGHLTYEVVKDPGAGSSSVVSNSGFGDALLDRYFGHYASCNIWAASDAMVPGEVFTSSMLFPDSRLKSTEYWSGWLRHVDVFYVVGGIVHDDAQARTKVSFVRPENRPPFGTQERDLLQTVAPHLHRSMRSQKRLARANALLAPVLHTLDELDHAVVVLRADGEVVHLNACAHELLPAAGPVRLQGGRLEFRSPELAERFQAMTRPGVSAARAGVMDFLLQGPDGQPLHAALLPLADGVAGPRHLVLFVRRARAAGLPAQALRAMYRLTGAEAELAQALAEGSTATEHAQARGISVHTVRTQLKSVLMKLGVNRQVDIVQTVSGFVRRHRAPH